MREINLENIFNTDKLEKVSNFIKEHKVSKYIDIWQKRLQLSHITILTEPIDRKQVTFPDDISDKDKYFVGIRLEDKIATIYHDRDLTEEDIVHELLHIANPDKSEEWVNSETDRLLENENES